MNLQPVKYFLNRFVLRRDSLVANARYDLRMHVKAEDVVGRHIYKYGAHEPGATAFLTKTLEFRDGDVAIDIGANIGWYSLVLDRLAGDKRVDIYSFEPEPTNFELLERNVLENAATHVRPQARAVADAPGEMTMYLFKKSNRGRHSLLASEGTDTVQVSTLTLDEFWESADLGERVPRFIKLDIEGFELMALRGGTRVVARCPLVMLEYSPELMRAASVDPGELIRVMLNLGFVPHVLQADELAPADPEELIQGAQQVDLFWKNVSAA